MTDEEIAASFDRAADASEANLIYGRERGLPSFNIERRVKAMRHAAHVLRTAPKAIDAILALPTSPRPDGCWCGADTGLGERHLQSCDDARAALSAYREGPKP